VASRIFTEILMLYSGLVLAGSWLNMNADNFDTGV